jgi:hypothetical protein
VLGCTGEGARASKIVNEKIKAGAFGSGFFVPFGIVFTLPSATYQAKSGTAARGR